MKNIQPAGKAIVFSILAFCALGTTSAILYDGGNYFNDQSGYSFWLNYFCDSIKETGYNGNSLYPSNIYGAASLMALITGAIFPMWLYLPQQLSSQKKLNSIINRLALIAALGVCLIPASLLITFPFPHVILVMLAAIPGVIATALLAYVIQQEEHINTITKLTGWLIIIGSLIVIAEYLIEVVNDSYSFWLPASQKIIMLLLIAWMFMLVRAAKNNTETIT